VRRQKRPDRTIASELEWGTRKLARAGKPHPQMVALSAWAVLAGEKPGAIWLKRLTTPPSEDFTRTYRRAISEHAGGAPFQSAVGLAAFRTMELAIDRNVLIPRVETEDLVDRVLEWARAHGWGVAADVGTGSGALGLALAVEGGFERIIATDASPAALDVARRNAETVRPRTPVEFRQGSWLAPLEPGEVDVIVSNPPYLTTDECAHLLPEVRDYEPRMAFDGGADGLDPFREILDRGSVVLRAGGLMALEVDSRRPTAVLDLAISGGWADARVIDDVFGRPRYLLATRPR
jgi:release factor glutamine methyltransferase